MDGGAWKAAVHGVAEGRTRLSDFTSLHFMYLPDFTFQIISGPSLLILGNVIVIELEMRYKILFIEVQLSIPYSKVHFFKSH